MADLRPLFEDLAFNYMVDVLLQMTEVALLLGLIVLCQA